MTHIKKLNEIIQETKMKCRVIENDNNNYKNINAKLNKKNKLLKNNNKELKSSLTQFSINNNNNDNDFSYITNGNESVISEFNRIQIENNNNNNNNNDSRTIIPINSKINKSSILESHQKELIEKLGIIATIVFIIIIYFYSK